MRGLAPDDERRFDDEACARLRVAIHELAWLLDRGYPLLSALVFVGDRHQLDARQRLAIRRSVCSTAQREARAGKRLDRAAMRGADVRIDGFNVLITIETALGGGVVIEGLDGALRDLAGLRGSYHVVDQTHGALEGVARLLAADPPASVEWLLDAPVSNSGRLRDAILARAWPCAVRATVVSDPDAELAGASHVATSDGAVLDACASWHALARWAIAELGARPWLVRLAADDVDRR